MFPRINVLLQIRSQRSVGVLFDVGHGQGSFDWKVAEAAAQQGFWPDLISTDLHSGNVNGLAKDLPNVMTKLKALGMPIPKVIILHNGFLIQSPLRPGSFHSNFAGYV